MSATLSGLSAACRSTQLTVMSEKIMCYAFIKQYRKIRQVGKIWELKNNFARWLKNLFDVLVYLIFYHPRRIELATLEPLELGLPHVALHHGVKVLEPVELGAGDPAPKLLGLKNQECTEQLEI